MANGEILQEINELLKEDGAIKQSTALRLMLKMQAETYQKIQAQADKQAELEARIKKQEDTNIVLWIQNNPKLSFFLLTLYLIVASVVNIRDLLASAIGIK